MNITIILAISGFLLSVSTYRIGQKASKNPDYRAFCDINDRISCSNVINSSYGRLGGFTNSTYGMLFYSCLTLLAYIGEKQLVWYLSIMGLLTTIFLAYLLYFRIKSVCILCNLIYIINILLFLNSAML